MSFLCMGTQKPCHEVRKVGAVRLHAPQRDVAKVHVLHLRKLACRPQLNSGQRSGSGISFRATCKSSSAAATIW